MNRLQKKCLIATIGIHLSLLLVLIFGAAFFNPRSQPDDVHLLDVIPDTAIDAALSSGVKAAQPPAPKSIVTPPQPPPAPVPPQPQPVAKPPPTPAPSLLTKVEGFFKPEKLPPDDLKPVDDSAKPAEHKIKVDLTQVTHVVSKNSAQKSPDDSKQQREREKALERALRAIRNNLSSATEINLPGNSSVAYANYGAIVVSIYHQAFRAPDNMDNANATVSFSVTIARDGSVISSRIVKSSGDTSVDNAVQRMLDRVNYIEQFPEGSKDTERTYNIDFDATRNSLQ